MSGSNAFVTGEGNIELIEAIPQVCGMSTARWAGFAESDCLDLDPFCYMINTECYKLVNLNYGTVLVRSRSAHHSCRTVCAGNE